MDLHYVQIAVHWPRVAAYLSQYHHERGPAFRDPGFLVKTMLTDALGGTDWPRPFHVFESHPLRERGVGGVLAYCRRAAEELTAALNSGQTPPLLRSAFEPGGVVGYPLAEPAVGRRFQFQVRLCPTVRVGCGKDRRERDAFLVEAERRGAGGGVERGEVYGGYLARVLDGAATLEATVLCGFALRTLARKSSRRETGLETLTFPDAALEGILRVDDPPRFLTKLGEGVGRQRGYGFGMLRLKPC